MSPPLIAIPSYPRLRNGKIAGWGSEAFAVPSLYVDAVRRAGGLEAIVVTESIDELAEDILDRMDALLLLGGGDLEPASYGREPGAKIVGASTARGSAQTGCCAEHERRSNGGCPSSPCVAVISC